MSCADKMAMTRQTLVLKRSLSFSKGLNEGPAMNRYRPTAEWIWKGELIPPNGACFGRSVVLSVVPFEWAQKTLCGSPLPEELMSTAFTPDPTVLLERKA
jgi:hypothetical protein